MTKKSEHRSIWPEIRKFGRGNIPLLSCTGAVRNALYKKPIVWTTPCCRIKSMLGFVSISWWPGRPPWIKYNLHSLVHKHCVPPGYGRSHLPKSVGGQTSVNLPKSVVPKYRWTSIVVKMGEKELVIICTAVKNADKSQTSWKLPNCDGTHW